EPSEIRATDGRYEITQPATPLLPLRMQLCDCSCGFLIDPRKIHQIVYRQELERGYDYEGDLWSPGVFRVDLAENDRATLVGSTEDWDIIGVLSPSNARRAEEARRGRLLDQSVAAARRRVAAELVF